MKQENIDVRPFFIPLSEMEIYKKYKFSNTISCKMSELGFNLPTSYRMKESDLERVTQILKNV